MAEAKFTRKDLIKLLNEDLSREYQAIIAYVNYSQVLKGAAYMNIAGELSEIFGVEIVSHPDHDASFFFDGIGVGWKVVAFGFGVSRVTVPAFNTQVAFVLTHEFDDLVTSHVFGENLEVGGLGTRTSRLS